MKFVASALKILTLPFRIAVRAMLPKRLRHHLRQLRRIRRFLRLLRLLR